MRFFSRNRWLKKIDAARIEQAIRQAEQRTSGEIRVSIAPFFWGSVERAAERAFERLGMTHTEQHNAILFFVVPARHTFVVLGDRGIHERVGSDFWKNLVAIMTPYFQKHQFTEGLLQGIRTSAEELARHFPSAGASDVDELPNQVDFDA